AGRRTPVPFPTARLPRARPGSLGRRPGRTGTPAGRSCPRPGRRVSPVPGSHRPGPRRPAGPVRRTRRGDPSAGSRGPAVPNLPSSAGRREHLGCRPAAAAHGHSSTRIELVATSPGPPLPAPPPLTESYRPRLGGGNPEECLDVGGELRVMLEQEPVRRALPDRPSHPGQTLAGAPARAG